MQRDFAKETCFTAKAMQVGLWHGGAKKANGATTVNHR
jgi:hypothetical protein